MKKLAVFLLIISLLSLIPVSASAATQGSRVSDGKTYTLVTPASEAYPDNGSRLTDGVFATLPDGAKNYYNSVYYVGFNQKDVDESQNFVVIIDLGKQYDDLCAFTIGYLNETDIGIFAPKRVTFAVSDVRNGEYTDVGTLETEKATTAGLSETYASTLAAEAVAGRFVRVTITHLGGFNDENNVLQTAGWAFIDEIAVYSAGATGNTSDTTTTPPQTGDAGVIAYVLLALSAAVMLAALLIFRKRRSF